MFICDAHYLADWRVLEITPLGLEQRNLQHLTHWIGCPHLLQCLVAETRPLSGPRNPLSPIFYPFCLP